MKKENIPYLICAMIILINFILILYFCFSNNNIPKTNLKSHKEVKYWSNRISQDSLEILVGLKIENDVK